MNPKVLLLVAIFLLAVIVFLWGKRCKCNTHGCEGNKGKLFTSTMLWLDHLLYTRLVVMGILESREDLKQNLARLMKNQADIASHFGKDKDAVEKLLVEHITLAGKAVSDVKSSSPDTAADVKALYENADKIGSYLDSRSGSQTHFRHHMRMHIDTLVAMVKDAAAKKYDSLIESTDKYTRAGMEMAFDMSRFF